MIVIAYDGSVDAQCAVRRAGVIVRSQPATVLSVWESFADLMARVGAGLPTWPDEQAVSEVDRASEESARQRSEEGASLASAAGLEARALARLRTGTVAETILATAAELSADAIVLGTRGLGGVKSLMLGSVSHSVLQHADRPVLIVPSDDLAARRSRRDS